MSLYKCPHCGMTYDPELLGWDFVPVHPGPEVNGVRARTCLGSRQHPRNAETDFRPLWKDVCDVCDGEGSLDTGGVTPWGAGISEGCPKCKGSGKPCQT